MLKPLGHRLLIKPKAVEVVSKGGIIVVTNEDKAKIEQMQAARGTVLALGHTAYQLDSLGNKPWVSVGDDVYYAKFSGALMQDPYTGEDYVLLNDTDVVALIIKEEADDDTN